MAEVQLMFGEAAEIIERGEQEKYQNFVDKFKPAKTTDDCYTPPQIYDAIADWVANEYGISRDRFMRPFKPGGDYQNEEYPDGCAVVDNPPFSILTQIVDWYTKRRIKFFLFGPTLTLFSLFRRPERKKEICLLLIGAPIVYENGAEFQTSFVTNMDDYAVRIEPGIRDEIDRISEKLRREKNRQLPKYSYPDYILSGKDYVLAKYGQTLRIRHEDCVFVSAMDAQNPLGKAIFGNGVLLSERAAAERAAAERAAAERAAAEQKQKIVLELSEREKRIIRAMKERS